MKFASDKNGQKNCVKFDTCTCSSSLGKEKNSRNFVP